jgi:hypothetical protein
MVVRNSKTAVVQWNLASYQPKIVADSTDNAPHPPRPLGSKEWHYLETIQTIRPLNLGGYIDAHTIEIPKMGTWERKLED